LDRVVLEFLRLRSLDPIYATVEDTLLDPTAPEHIATIIETAEGKYRLGELNISEVADYGSVNVRIPSVAAGTLKPGEKFVGVIHTHPGPRTGEILAQSRDVDIPVATRLALSGNAFRWSYVVGPSGQGPYYGVELFQPLEGGRLGTLTSLVPLP
jgi:hypothetical protein